MTKLSSYGTVRLKRMFTHFMSLAGTAGINQFYCHYIVFTHRMVNTVAFHPDGNCLGVGTTDNVVKVLTLSDYELFLTFAL